MNIYRIILNKCGNEYDSVPNSYWRDVFFHKLFDVLRGYVKKFRFKNCGKRFQCGKNTIIKCPEYMDVGNNVIIGSSCKIQALTQNGIKIGDNVQIGDFSYINGTSVPYAIGKELKIGNNSSFGEFCHFGAVGGLTIGNNVIAGQFVRFHAENHKFDSINEDICKQGTDWKGIYVGNNCWIGAGAVFLDGVHVEDGCVIGANTVLKGHYPANSIIVGAPGRVCKTRGNDESIKAQSSN